MCKMHTEHLCLQKDAKGTKEVKSQTLVNFSEQSAHSFAVQETVYCIFVLINMFKMTGLVCFWC